MNLDKEWSCSKKNKARYNTIITQYQKYFDTNSLPKNKQYWTIGGICVDDYNQIYKGSELHQIIENKLITPEQFHSAEIEEKIYNKNKNSNIKTNWYLGDFYNAMVNCQNFNPGIVNADMLYFPKKGAKYLSKIISLLEDSTNNVMLVGNFILRDRYREFSKEDIILELNKCAQFHYAWDTGNWKTNNKIYLYKGTGHTPVIMGTIILIKK